MKILRYVLYGLGSILLIYLVLCVFGKSSMSVTRSLSMNASPQAIFEEIADFSRWNAWSPWHKMDPNMKSVITGNPGEVGHKETWMSDNGNVGTGSQEFVEVTPNAHIKSQMKFNEEDDTPAYSDWNLEAEGEGTKVTWSMQGTTPFFFRGMALIMNMDKIVGQQFEQGLNDLKAIAEAKPKTASMAYEIVEMPDQWYVGITHPGILPGQIDSSLFSEDYGKIMQAIGGMDKVAGMPMSIAHNYNNETGAMDLEIAMPVGGEMKVGQGLSCGKIPAGKIARYVYTGPYEDNADEWTAFMDQVSAKHKMRGDGYEVYVNDPGTVKSPAEYITWLMIPVE